MKDFIWDTRAAHRGEDKIFAEVINNYLDLYLQDCWCKEVDDSFWEYDANIPFYICNSGDKFMSSYKRILRYSNNTGVTWKVKSGERTTYFVLKTTKSSNGQQYPDGEITIFDNIDDDEWHGCLVTKFTTHLDMNGVCEEPEYRKYLTPQVPTGGRTSSKKIDMYLEKYDIRCFLFKALRYLRNEISLRGDDEDIVMPIVHTNLEMELFRSVLHLTAISTGSDWVKRYMVTSISPDPDITPILLVNDIFKKTNDDVISDYNELNPTISLSDRDWKFIVNYTSKKNLIGITHPVDLVSLSSNQPYGCRFFDKITSKDGTSFDALVELEVSDTYDVAQFTIVTKLESYGYARTKYDLKNAHSYTLRGADVINFTTCILFEMTDEMDIPQSYEEVAKVIPNDLLSANDAYYILITYLRFMTVLKERPTNYKVIAESMTKQSANNDSSAPKHKSSIVTKRIIKTVYGAKKYIKEHNTGDSERQYVMENWTRREHERHLKNGKIVHIGQSQCVRHKPLAIKEIRIAL